MIALDTEDTGKDLFHGSKPFLVTFALPDGTQPYCEWVVDPETREPQVDPSDVSEIRRLIDDADELVLQNAKFDATALSTIGIDDFPWEKVHDTLIAAHLLASNRPKDLTTLATIYLGRSIQKHEDQLQDAVEECRKFARNHMPQWRIAKFGLPDMPSLKKSSKDKDSKVWKSDCWLPRCVADYLDYEPDHSYRTLLRDYANEDSSCTLAIWIVMKEELHRRGLWDIYDHRRKLLPVIYDMEMRGVTMSRSRLEEIYKQYSEESKVKASVCLNIAESLGFALELPNGGAVNTSLRMFCFDVLNLEPVRNPKAKTDAPCLDAKNAIPYYLDTLPQRSKSLRFIESLVDKRSCDTATGYMDQYLKYGLPLREGDDNVLVLHPWINPTGTETLRFSFSNPNSANVSGQDIQCRECRGEGCEQCDHTGNWIKSPRYAFGPDAGREWFRFDAQNLELRIPAYESEQEEFIQLFERPKDPPFYGSNHLLVASIVFPEEWKKTGCDGKVFKDKFPNLYKKVKSFDFAVQYGAIDRSDGRGTADRTVGVPGAQAMIKAKFYKQEALNQKWIQFANRHGYVETIPDRTVDPKRGYPLLCSRSDWGGVSPTVPLNYHVQGCLSGNTRVLTDSGHIPIKELVGVACKVWTGFKWANAVGVNMKACRRARITLGSGLVIECDTRHKLKNELDDWVEFNDIKEGSFVALPTNPDPLNYSGSISKWFLFGFILGDGYLCHRENRRQLTITGGLTKKQELEHIYNFIRGLGYNTDSYGRPSGPIWRVVPASMDRSEKYCVSIENREFSNFLEQHGFSFDWKSDTKHIPESVWRADPQQRRDFLQGLFRSDGVRSSTAGAGFKLNMTNPQLLREIQVLSSDLGFDSTITSSGLTFRWRAKGAKSSRKYPHQSILNKVHRSPTYYSTVGVSNTVADRRNYKLAKSGINPSQYVAERIIRNSCQSAEMYRYDRVVKIEVLDNEEITYTMSVDDPLHQYTAGGVIHKNSAMWWTAKAMIRVYEFFTHLNNGGIYDGRTWPGGYYIALQVHDELDLDFPSGRGKSAQPWEYNLPVVREVKRLMELGGQDFGGIPTPCSVEYHESNWNDSIPITDTMLKSTTREQPEHWERLSSRYPPDPASLVG